MLRENQGAGRPGALLLTRVAAGRVWDPCPIAANAGQHDLAGDTATLPDVNLILGKMDASRACVRSSTIAATAGTTFIDARVDVPEK